jgi:hypothetical protein
MHKHDVKTGAHGEKPCYVTKFPVTDLYPRLHKKMKQAVHVPKLALYAGEMSLYDAKHCDPHHRRHHTL